MQGKTHFLRPGRGSFFLCAGTKAETENRRGSLRPPRLSALAKRPQLCWGEQKGFRCQFRAKQDSINTKRCSTQREAPPRLQGAGQVMQEAGYPVPLERLAVSMPFQGLRKPQP